MTNMCSCRCEKNGAMLCDLIRVVIRETRWHLLWCVLQGLVLGFCFHLHSMINLADKKARVSEEQQRRDWYSNSNQVSILERCTSMQIYKEINNAKSTRIFGCYGQHCCHRQMSIESLQSNEDAFTTLKWENKVELLKHVVFGGS